MSGRALAQASATFANFAAEIISEHDKIELPQIKPFIKRHR
jgi:hypothetical protein